MNPKTLLLVVIVSVISLAVLLSFSIKPTKPTPGLDYGYHEPTPVVEVQKVELTEEQKKAIADLSVIVEYRQIMRKKALTEMRQEVETHNRKIRWEQEIARGDSEIDRLIQDARAKSRGWK